ncbi:glutathione hydrolase 1 proenzyme-like [Patiria miniata]|uniref:Gamma-glutamyltranspeptidase 1 n=1 Tax=Patiria miniata TaxID=46514 RepID=A0A914AHM1_PATMI|nr:glutathione hydrolase 1 proenzyme-like [Patiria miniata]
MMWRWQEATRPFALCSSPGTGRLNCAPILALYISWLEIQRARKHQEQHLHQLSSIIPSSMGDAEQGEAVRGPRQGEDEKIPFVQGDKQSAAHKKGRLAIIIFFVLFIGAAIVVLPITLHKVPNNNKTIISKTHTEARPAVPGRYQSAAVAADVGLCSEMGRDILKQGGTAVDASITTLLCIGVVNAQSSGLGGGMFMLVYHKNTSKTEALVAKERAPAAANANTFPEKSGIKSVAVPSELSGMWEAHQRYGHLPWTALFEPVIRLAEDGFPVTVHLANARRQVVRGLNLSQPQFAGFRTRYANADGSWKEVGDTVYAPKMARTLRAIARNGISEFSNGTTAQQLVQEIQEYGGLITAADLAGYTAEWREAQAVPIGRGMTVLTTPSPSGGPVVQFIINILRNYNMSSADFKTTGNKIKTYHHFVEASKFAFALRSHLGDVETPEVQEILNKMQSEAFAKSISSQIREDAVTFTNASGYNALLNTAVRSGGTSHISVVDQFGNAVSATSSINNYFGSHIFSNTTGLILNNEMADFDSPASQPASDANYIAPGKMPVSAMSPVIVLNENGGAELVAGSAGSRAIITTNAWVTLRSVFTDASLKEIIDDKRIHNQLQPENIAVYEKGFQKDVINGLHSMGHKTEQKKTPLSVSQAIRRLDNWWMAYSDPRKQGYAAGY